MRQRLRQRKLKIENKHLRKRDYFAMIIPSCSHSSVVKVRCKWTGGSTVEVNIETEKFTVVCSLCRQNLEI